MLLLIFIIAIVNLALGFALALYFDPARGAEMKVVIPPPTATIAEEQTLPTQSQPAEPPAEEPTEPTDESPPEAESAEEELEPTREQAVVSDVGTETTPQRETAACEQPLNEFREHIDAHLGLLRDMEQRLRAGSDSLEVDEVSKLATDLVAYHAEFDAHMNQLLNELDVHRDNWVEATHTIEAFMTELRETKQATARIDSELGTLGSMDDVDLAEENLSALLQEAISLGFEHRDRVEGVRSEMMFDMGLLPQLTPEDFRSGQQGVLNRLGIETTIRQWRQKQASSTRPYSLAVLGVDRLSELNQQFGTSTVDIILGHVANLALEAIRSEDAVGYFDGSKFLLFFPETGPASATSYLERLRQNLEATTFQHADTSLVVTTSCGVVEGDPDDAIDALAMSAVETMKSARGEGGNCTLVFEHGEPSQVSPPDYGAAAKTIAL